MQQQFQDFQNISKVCWLKKKLVSGIAENSQKMGMEFGTGAYRGAKGVQCPGRRITGGRRKVLTIPQVLSSIQCICSRKTLGLDMGAPNLFLSPGAV